ncbi:hypothetical protein J6590_058838 [Homalodisca vitripennis]|nr:hypothetical protein J6590_058838 [Homalodisca vitripennis]
MEIILHEDLIPLDTYRTYKSDVVKILNKNGIQSSDTDTVADLRPILAALKNLTRISASHPNIKTIFNNLTTRKTHLSEEDRENYKDLATIEDFLAQKTNLYDTVHNPEAEIKTQAPPILVHYELLTLSDRTNTATMGENIPLISAGTYTDLQSENPQDNTKVNLFPAHLSGTAQTWFKHYKQKQLGRRRKSRTGFEKRRSGVPVLVFVCGKNFWRNKCQEQKNPMTGHFKKRTLAPEFGDSEGRDLEEIEPDNAKLLRESMEFSGADAQTYT